MLNLLFLHFFDFDDTIRYDTVSLTMPTDRPHNRYRNNYCREAVSSRGHDRDLRMMM